MMYRNISLKENDSKPVKLKKNKSFYEQLGHSLSRLLFIYGNWRKNPSNEGKTRHFFIRLHVYFCAKNLPTQRFGSFYSQDNYAKMILLFLY